MTFLSSGVFIEDGEKNMETYKNTKPLLKGFSEINTFVDILDDICGTLKLHRLIFLRNNR